jgi:hypothetical protein
MENGTYNMFIGGPNFYLVNLDGSFYPYGTSPYLYPTDLCGTYGNSGVCQTPMNGMAFTNNYGVMAFPNYLSVYHAGYDNGPQIPSNVLRFTAHLSNASDSLYSNSSLYVSLLSPENNVSINSSQVLFSYNLNYSSLVSKCELLIDGNSVQNSYNLSSGNQSFIYNLDSGNYDWSVKCVDENNLSVYSEVRSLNVVSIIPSCTDFDLNFDNAINDADVVAVRSLIGLSDCSSFNSWCNYSDINLDGKVSASDMREMRKYYSCNFSMKLPPEPPFALTPENVSDNESINESVENETIIVESSSSSSSGSNHGGGSSHSSSYSSSSSNSIVLNSDFNNAVGVSANDENNKIELENNFNDKNWFIRFIEWLFG